MSKLVLREPNDGPEDQQCSRIGLDGSRQVVRVDELEVPRLAGGRTVDIVEVLKLVEGRLMDVRVIRCKLRDVEGTSDCRKDRWVLACAVSLRDEPDTSDALIPGLCLDYLSDRLVDGGH